ncbi:MAG TPA: hypothetical protein DER52_05760 [Glaciecola sp.]|nr:hypothetical protein [Glaciecola sp.]
MKRVGLVVTQRIAYKVTTKRKHSDAVADNLLNMNFNPVGLDQNIMFWRLITNYQAPAALSSSDAICANKEQQYIHCGVRS